MPVYRDGQEVNDTVTQTTLLSSVPTSFIIADPVMPTKRTEVSPMGELRVATHVRLVGSTLTGNSNAWIDSNFWTTQVSGTGSINATSGAFVLATGADASSYVNLLSVRTGRYIGGTPNYYRGALYLDAKVSGNIRRWGAFSSSDGAYFELTGSSGLLCQTRRSGVTDNHVPEVAVTVDDGKVHMYEIYYQNSKATFVVDEVMVHEHKPTGSPWTHMLHLPLKMTNQNSGISGNIKMIVNSATINRIGEPFTRPRYYYFNSNQIVNLKVGPGTLHSLMVGTPGGSNNILSIYDSLTSSVGSLIFVMDTSNAAATGVSLQFELDFNNGLTVGATAGTPAKSTVMYE